MHSHEVKQAIQLTGRRSYTLIVTSVLCTFVEARDDVLLRPRLWREGAIACVLKVSGSGNGFRAMPSFQKLYGRVQRSSKAREIDTTWMILRWKYRSG
jgi:hypothetical protein